MDGENIRPDTGASVEKEKEPLCDEERATKEQSVNLSEKEKSSDHKQEVDDDEKDEDSIAPDRGWGWWCVFGCAVVNFVTSGMERSGGVLLVELQEKFEQSAGVSAWVVSLSATFRLLFGPVASMLSNKFSCRVVVVFGGILCALGVLVSGFAPSLIFLYFSYGLFCGLGKSFAYTPGLVIVGHYFNKRRGMAVGLASAGGGLGTLALPPIIQLLFKEFRYQGALMILSGFALQICVGGSLYMPLNKYLQLLGLKTTKSESDMSPHEIESIPLHQIPSRKNSKKTSLQDCEQPLMISKDLEKVKSSERRDTEDDSDVKSNEKKPKLLDIKLLKNPIFFSLCIAILFLALAFNSVLVFIPPLAVSIGLSKLEGALVLSMAGICDTISRFVSGVILDLERVKRFRMYIYNGALFMLAILTFCLTFVTSFAHLLIIAAFYGLFIGTYSSQKSVILADLLGTNALSSAFGILICFQGVGTLLGPPFTGLLKDLSDSFDDGFYFSSGVTLLGALILSSGNIYQLCRSREGDEKTDDEIGNVQAESQRYRDMLLTQISLNLEFENVQYTTNAVYWTPLRKKRKRKAVSFLLDTVDRF